MTRKLVILGPRKDGLSRDECIEYMPDEHVPKVEERLGLRKYKTAIPADPDEAGYDELAELRFDDPAAVDEALQSEAGEEVMEDAEAFVDAEMIVVTDETTHLDET